MTKIQAEKTSNVFKRLWNKVVDGVAADKPRDPEKLKTNETYTDTNHFESQAQIRSVPQGDKGIER